MINYYVPYSISVIQVTEISIALSIYTADIVTVACGKMAAERFKYEIISYMDSAVPY